MAERPDEFIEVPVEHVLKLVQGQVDSVIGDAILREIVGPDLRGPVPGPDHRSSLPRPRGFQFGQSPVQQPGPQHFQGPELVLQL